MLKDLWWYLILRGVFALALGAFALFWPNLSIGILVTVVGAFCILDGSIGLAFTFKDTDLREYLVVSVLTIAIGLVLVIWSTGAVKFVLILFGAWLVFVGGGQIMSGRRLPRGDSTRSLLTFMGAVVAVVGLVLIVWPGTGIVVVSWGIAAAAIIGGAQSIFMATQLRNQ
jgi:uncharacterized membrane protein HdeD (DUF308 family)